MYNAFLCTRATKEGKNVKPTIVIPSKSHSAAVFILLEGNLPKPRNPYPFGGKPPKAWEPLLWTDQPTNDQPTD